MRLRVSVSFEHDTAPVDTYRGELQVANARLGARRALEAASKAFPNRRWRSVVILLERVGEGDGESEGESEGPD